MAFLLLAGAELCYYTEKKPVEETAHRKFVEPDMPYQASRF
jgi:hypothetical protein